MNTTTLSPSSTRGVNWTHRESNSSLFHSAPSKQSKGLFCLYAFALLLIFSIDSVQALELSSGTPEKVDPKPIPKVNDATPTKATPTSSRPISLGKEDNGDNHKSSGGRCHVCDARRLQAAKVACYTNLTAEASTLMHIGQFGLVLNLFSQDRYVLCSEDLWHTVYRPFFVDMIKRYNL